MKPRLKMIRYTGPVTHHLRDLGYLWFCVGGGCSSVAFTPDAAYSGWKRCYARGIA